MAGAGALDDVLNYSGQICGLRLTVEDGIVTSVRGNPDDPLSRGYICPNGFTALEGEVALHQKAWNGTISIANEVIQIITTIRRSLVKVETKVESAEKTWLAFWGIYKESLGEHRPWI